VLLGRVDTSERTRVIVTAPARRSRFELRVPGQVRRFGRLGLRESVLLELPLGRAPPQGAILEAVTTVRLPRPPKNGFDERTWLRRHGIHVVLRADRWRQVGRRGGLGGVADRLRAALAGSIAPGLSGERRGIVEGVVLGDEQALSERLRQRFRVSGLYHLLAVSGQNVVLVAGGALALAWLLGLPRWLGQLGALASIGGYVLAVGAQPSVIRAGVAGALVSLAWLAARPADRWYFLLLGAFVLLAWNPYSLLDPGFQLSFAAVAAIFVLAPRLARVLEGYPVPGGLAAVLAVSTACGLATAPVLWFQFHAIPLLTVPANAAAAPAVAPLLGLAFASALAGPVSPTAAAAIAWLNGWCAAYLAACARLVGGLPGAQVRSGRALALLVALAAATGAYAWRRWQTSSPRT
jgi:competence protein ComEC